MIYNIYYLRATQTHFEKLISLAVRLQILTSTLNEETKEEVISCPDGAYDYIGPISILSDTPDVEGVYSVIGERRNAAGEVLIHANLVLPYSLNEVGALIAEEDTETATVFASLKEYFVTGKDGRATSPVAPSRVFLNVEDYPPYVPPEPAIGEAVEYKGEE